MGQVHSTHHLIFLSLVRDNPARAFLTCAALILVSVALSACGNQDGRPISTNDVFRPPTLIPTESPTAQIISGGVQDVPSDELHPTPTPSCTNGLWFLGDLTIPDGTVVSPGDMLDKRWEVSNHGTCNWDERYRVKLIAGPGMGVPVQQALVPALSGTEVVIRMIFIAPDEPGNYRSAWQAYDPSDVPFGDPFFIDIVVESFDTTIEGE